MSYVYKLREILVSYSLFVILSESYSLKTVSGLKTPEKANLTEPAGDTKVITCICLHIIIAVSKDFIN